MIDLLHVTDLAGIAPLYLSDERTARADRPWVVMGMIESLDGAATVDGRSSALGGPPDREAFRALRAVADVVMVGASTVRTEQYRAVDLPPGLVEWRRGEGKSDNPMVAVVSAALDFELTPSLAAARPIVLTCAVAPEHRRAELATTAEVVVVGDDRVDLPAAVRLLGDRGAGVVTLEGGPLLNGQMVEHGLVDEVCVTIAPRLASGDAYRIVRGVPTSLEARPVRIVHCEGFLLVRALVT